MTVTESKNPEAARIEKFIALIDEMIQIVAEENSELALGVPAPRSKLLSRKVELAEAFEKWVADVTSRKLSLANLDVALKGRLMDRVGILQKIMDENVIKLRAAIEASQMRIDAVMRAIRERISVSAPYAADGRRCAPLVSCTSNLHA
ncbi:hypothetical protein [Rhodoplanes sp. Z2-YC6860]|uniref:hypothetical protein n=1 Tax=Rhodoplanes sp. Z2-YC6860 TaxID=674703 RepID=UPI00078E548B|nr:hypothetical protein [Rhodoplanes sp. Z2-YC6860]AMN39092.1 hypothetical protein RHPLAN_06300 [Rhodoplanes sp. Z2-YC6860]